MKEKRAQHHSKPAVATGMDDREELEQKASDDEVRRGDSTEVTTLRYDEVEPS
ncbi:hypothetical protein [Desmospora profundinema]|uniref:Uncharacterized protein n=1 Tax=Desmospora profundinema TaxID=1571184 RepID=A0ABU1II05_9BACL|nr:hypothetical protein [Desmospora profundinema]MDR6224398.1 hypothetical protein [Desmospora profundinema]